MRSPATRRRLLALAAVLDGWAQGIRRYVRRQTPKRTRLTTPESP